MRKCICILTSAHPIDDVRVYRKIALSLVKYFDIIWIGPDRGFFEKELGDDGITRILVEDKRGTIGRLYTNARVIKTFIRHKRDIQFVYFPDPDLAFIFTSLVRSKGIRKIFDIHEVYHKELLYRKIKGIPYLLLRKLVESSIKKIVRNVDLVIGVNATVLNYYISGKTPQMVIRNCLPKSFANFQFNNFPKKEKFTLVHGKNHMFQGTLIVLDALRLLKGKGIKCKVLMINQENSEQETFKSYVDRYDINSYIDLHDGLPFIEMLNQMLQCQAGLISYGRDLGVDSLPNRFFEYLALGLPVIVPGFSKEMVNIVENEKCGLVIDTESPLQLAEAIEYLLKNPKLSEEMGWRGKNAFFRNHNWEAEIDSFINYIKAN